MEGLEKRGSAGRWGESNTERRVYWTRARPILASAAGFRNAGMSTEKIRGEPRLLTSLSDTTHGGADRVGLLWAALDSPVLLEGRGSLQCCGDIPSAGGAGARNCTAISASNRLLLLRRLMSCGPPLSTGLARLAGSRGFREGYRQGRPRPC